MNIFRHHYKSKDLDVSLADSIQILKETPDDEGFSQQPETIVARESDESCATNVVIVSEICHDYPSSRRKATVIHDAIILIVGLYRG